jgi:hypothetical protein
MRDFSDDVGTYVNRRNMRLALFDKFRRTGVDYHVEETTLERYSMGSLEAEILAKLEQHLLLCEMCRARVIAADAYIHTMKVAVGMLPVDIEQPAWNFRLLQAFVVYALLMVVSVVSFAPSDRHHAPAAIALAGLRGAEEAHGPSGRLLVLQPDLNGLAAAASYRIEMVNDSGSLIWRGAFLANAKGAGALVPPKSPGLYFVRLSLLSGKLLREYALELSN